MRRFNQVVPLKTGDAIRTFFPGVETVLALGSVVAKAGFGMMCLVAASDLKAVYFDKGRVEMEANTTELLRKRGMIAGRADCPEAGDVIPHSLKMRQAKFAAAVHAAIEQEDVNALDQYNMLPLQYVIATNDLDGLFTLVRKGLVITSEAIEAAKQAGCSENFIGALTVLYKNQENAKEDREISRIADEVAEIEIASFKGPSK